MESMMELWLEEAEEALRMRELEKGLGNGGIL